MARITKNDVRRVWDLYITEAKASGFDTTDWTLRMGSPSYGVPFEGHIGEGRAVPGAIGEGFSSGYLGVTAGDAYNALRFITETMRTVRLLHNPE